MDLLSKNNRPRVSFNPPWAHTLAPLEETVGPRTARCCTTWPTAQIFFCKTLFANTLSQHLSVATYIYPPICPPDHSSVTPLHPPTDVKIQILPIAHTCPYPFAALSGHTVDVADEAPTVWPEGAAKGLTLTHRPHVHRLSQLFPATRLVRLMKRLGRHVQHRARRVVLGDVRLVVAHTVGQTEITQLEGGIVGTILRSFRRRQDRSMRA